eukprot:gnl/MRDRNA2_/MRDRNA2_15658_c0_seq1.p1 gnl/MRDRNA2_/MRDRNA2_15658_c0~~gnl/MRDRNA2_/MRDRNA2_15658_c0_seq1.p1  ORF type:complete len:524 (+),score=77.46 gnl/MRDRNA2_/MRDRNA2_15658_c0_seq1:89-1573(+)
MVDEGFEVSALDLAVSAGSIDATDMLARNGFRLSPEGPHSDWISAACRYVAKDDPMSLEALFCTFLVDAGLDATESCSGQDLGQPDQKDWTVIWQKSDFKVPPQDIPTLANNSARIWVRDMDDHTFSAFTKKKGWPLERLRAGKAFSQTSDHPEEVTLTQVREAWCGLEIVLNCLKVPCGHGTYNLEGGVLYHPVGNHFGLCLGCDGGLCCWQYKGYVRPNVEVLVGDFGAPFAALNVFFDLQKLAAHALSNGSWRCLRLLLWSYNVKLEDTSGNEMEKAVRIAIAHGDESVLQLLFDAGFSPDGNGRMFSLSDVWRKTTTFLPSKKGKDVLWTLTDVTFEEALSKAEADPQCVALTIDHALVMDLIDGTWVKKGDKKLAIYYGINGSIDDGEGWYTSIAKPCAEDLAQYKDPHSTKPTPLYWAIAAGQLRICKLILNQKADVTLCSGVSHYVSPIEQAAHCGNHDIVELIAEKIKTKFSDPEIARRATKNVMK